MSAVLLLCSSLCFLCLSWPAGGCPAATYLSFASPKESKQRKGDPTGWGPALRFGQPVLPRQSGGPRKLASLRFAQTARGPDPAFPGHHRPSQNGVGKGFGSGFGVKSAACAEWAGATRYLICSVFALPGAMSVRLFGCSAVRLFGCSAVRLFGCSAVWLLVLVFHSPAPSVCAEERSFRRIRAARCLSEASLRGPRLKRVPQGARSEAQGRRQ